MGIPSSSRIHSGSITLVDPEPEAVDVAGARDKRARVVQHE
jgi:hypothetical protein